MDSKPHTHRLYIYTGSEHSDLAYFKIGYGDTRTHAVKHLPFRAKRVKFAIWRAIRRHDRGSVKAQRVEDIVEACNERFREMVEEPNGYQRTAQREAWGSKLLRERVH